MGVELKVTAHTKDDLISYLEEVRQKIIEGFTSGYGWDLVED
jgi:hypothetical protein